MLKGGKQRQKSGSTEKRSPVGLRVGQWFLWVDFPFKAHAQVWKTGACVSVEDRRMRKCEGYAHAEIALLRAVIPPLRMRRFRKVARRRNWRERRVMGLRLGDSEREREIEKLRQGLKFGPGGDTAAQKEKV